MKICKEKIAAFGVAFMLFGGSQAFSMNSTCLVTPSQMPSVFSDEAEKIEGSTDEGKVEEAKLLSFYTEEAAAEGEAAKAEGEEAKAEDGDKKEEAAEKLAFYTEEEAAAEGEKAEGGEAEQKEEAKEEGEDK